MFVGQAGRNTHNGGMREDEFLPELRGYRAVKQYREMRDNSAEAGAVFYAIEQVLRDVPYTVKPANDTDAALKEAEFVEQVLEDMDHTLDDHISEALSFLSMGFSIFEKVFKVRGGPYEKDPKKRSKYSDGRIGIRKLASRAQWTINKFDIDRVTGDCLGVWQNVHRADSDSYIPANKLVHYHTTTTNNDPSGRSILRNAYVPYTYLKRLQEIEAVGIERELHGIPIGRIPASYLAEDATDDEKAVRSAFEKILRDLKNNEQGFALLPSDLHHDSEKGFTDKYLVDLQLITSQGNRNIDISPVIQRYQHAITRATMAEFLMLGSGSGSYALSKSKTDLFLRSNEAYINSVFDVINQQIIEPLWRINGLDFALMPRICAGDVAPHDLQELSGLVRNLNQAIDMSKHPETLKDIMDAADLAFDETKIQPTQKNKPVNPKGDDEEEEDSED